MIRLRKPYVRYTEGIQHEAVVVFGKRPIYRTGDSVNQYEYKMQIDLWLVIIRMTWSSRMKVEKENV